MRLDVSYFRAESEAELCVAFLAWQTDDFTMLTEVDRPLSEHKGSSGVVVRRGDKVLATGFFALVKYWELEGLIRI